MNLLHSLEPSAAFFRLLPDRVPPVESPRMYRKRSLWVGHVEQPFLVPPKLKGYPVRSSDDRALEAELRTM
jgi:hypothetical protein